MFTKLPIELGFPDAIIDIKILHQRDVELVDDIHEGSMSSVSEPPQSLHRSHPISCLLCGGSSFATPVKLRKALVLHSTESISCILLLCRLIDVPKQKSSDYQ